jgi:hypothetical protein
MPVKPAATVAEITCPFRLEEAIPLVFAKFQANERYPKGGNSVRIRAAKSAVDEALGVVA